MADKNIEIAKYQGEIENYIGLGPGSIVFEFDEVGGKIELSVITVNPRHRQSFLFHQMLQGIIRHFPVGLLITLFLV